MAVAAKILTTVNLRRRGLALEIKYDTFCLCGRERESIDHLYVHWEFASSLWRHFLKESSVAWCLPHSLVG